MAQYEGSCHCGALKFSFDGEEITRGLRCTCSICRRKGALMTEYLIAPDDLAIECESGAYSTYSFGTDVARHHFCNTCGIYAFHETMRKPGHYRVNLGCIPEIDVFELPVTIFDGASI